MGNCKVCGDETETVFNINFKATPICEGCAISIFLQQAMWYGKEFRKNNNVKNKQCSTCGGEGKTFGVLGWSLCKDCEGKGVINAV